MKQSFQREFPELFHPEWYGVSVNLGQVLGGSGGHRFREGSWKVLGGRVEWRKRRLHAEWGKVHRLARLPAVPDLLGFWAPNFPHVLLWWILPELIHYSSLCSQTCHFSVSSGRLLA